MKKLVFEVYPIVNGQGPVKFLWQKSLGNYIAITGANKTVSIYDRHGEHKSDVVIVLPGLCTSLDWDKDGDMLSIAQDKTGVVFLWNAHNYEVTKLDTGMKESVSLCLWAKNTHLLAIGTSRGNLFLYNHRTRRKTPILGKHAKKITCGAWSGQNLLALGSEDKSLSVSNIDGDTIKQVPLRAEPSSVQFSHTKQDVNTTLESTVSAVVGHKTLFLMEIDNTDHPVELAFQPRYGDIVAYTWFSNGYILIGFSEGFFIVISTHKQEIGQEIFQSHNHKNFLSDIAVSPALNQAASCGDNSIKIHDLNALKEVYSIVDVEEEKGTLRSLQWTDDGQLLTVSTTTGGVFTYLAKLPLLGDAAGTRLAYLTSLLEVTIVNNVEEEQPLKLEVTTEPSFVAMGPFHIAYGVNDRVWIHELGEIGEVFEKSYLGSVNSFKLNGYYAAALHDGKICLHLIDSTLDIGKESNGLEMYLLANLPTSTFQGPRLPTDADSSGGTHLAGDREGTMFPPDGKQDTVTCHCFTQEFLIYSTESGSLVYFYLEDWKVVNEFKHVVGITKLYPDPSGTRLVIVDEKSDAFLYNPVDDSVLEIPDFSPGTKGVLWENWPLDKHVFAVYDAENVHTYLYFRDTINGPVCDFVGSTKLPFGHHPLMLYNGEVSCQTLTGKISIMRLATHSFADEQEMTVDELKMSFSKCLSLRRLKEAWSYAIAVDGSDLWHELAKTALKYLDLDIAIRAYQRIEDIAMVLSLQQIQAIEDRNLLVGSIAMVLESYQQAQELFLASSVPTAALNMRRDLLHWDHALQLAKTLSPDQIPYISKEYATQLEFMGDFGNSLLHYEQGITKLPEDKEHDVACTGGVARMALKTGDIRRGVALAQTVNSKQLKKECASILDDLKLYAEAATLYESSDSWDKATSVYMKGKNWRKAGELLERVVSPKLHAQYAKAREADGHFKEAAKAYETAKDYDSAVRIHLFHLNSLDDAVRIVKETQSIEGAKLVAKFFQKLGDVASALQFLVLSKCQEEAFHMAEKDYEEAKLVQRKNRELQPDQSISSHNYMEQYAEVIGDEASIEDYLRMAAHFRKNNEHLKAGQFFFKAKEYDKALTHFLSCPMSAFPDGDHIDMAIGVVGEAKDEALTEQLTDYLMGETDSTPKDAKYLFRLNLATEKYKEAARTALLIAREDQTAGNYRNAHDVLFYMYSELTKHNIKIPSDMVFNLMILHSYILVKMHVKLGDHLKGARMLIRVANNISKFPSHIVPILTSTVIECHRSGLRNSAFSYAAMLMRPEYRQKIDQKWKKKIEQIVRKPDKSEVEEELVPCPYCDHLLPQTKLDCPQCKNTIPYCIVTGFHMVKDDWTQCPVCKFPALYSEFVSLLKSSPKCPMCTNQVAAPDLVKVDDVPALLPAN